MSSIRLSNLRVAWSTGSGAGAGSAELRQCTREQVYMLEKRHRWKKSIRRKLHLDHIAMSVFCSVWRRRMSRRKGVQTVQNVLLNGIYSLLLASHSALSTPGGSAVRANMSVCEIPWHTYCCCRYGRSSRLLLLIPLGRRQRRVNEAETERKRQRDRKYRCVKQSIGQWINYSCCSQ